jgi:hypothetical protein
MTVHTGAVRENRIVEFSEGRLIAWLPAPIDEPAPGHLWRWELEPIDDHTTRVRHTYDWTNLTDEARLPRARATGPDQLMASMVRLAAAATSTAH